MSLFSDILDVVKENPVAAAVCAGAGAVVVGTAWGVKAAFGSTPTKTQKAAERASNSAANAAADVVNDVAAAASAAAKETTAEKA